MNDHVAHCWLLSPSACLKLAQHRHKLNVEKKKLVDSASNVWETALETWYVEAPQLFFEDRARTNEADFMTVHVARHLLPRESSINDDEKHNMTIGVPVDQWGITGHGHGTRHGDVRQVNKFC